MVLFSSVVVLPNEPQSVKMAVSFTIEVIPRSKSLPFIAKIHGLCASSHIFGCGFSHIRAVIYFFFFFPSFYANVDSDVLVIEGAEIDVIDNRKHSAVYVDTPWPSSF